MIDLTKIFLGVDYGTTKVKATLVDNYGVSIANYSRSWAELGCMNNMIDNWLHAFLVIVNGIFSEVSFYSRNQLGGIGITTISPSLIVVDTERGFSSPLIGYNEPIPNRETKDKFRRSEQIVQHLESIMISTGGRDLSVMTGNSWLAWMLTGVVSIDAMGVAECFGRNKKPKIGSVSIPNNLLSPTSVIGTLKSDWANKLSFQQSTYVVSGGSDTLGLIRAGDLKKGDFLLYLGTFFSVLEVKENVNYSSVLKNGVIPYRWHISLPGGSIIERLASSFYCTTNNRSMQIKQYLEEAFKKHEDTNGTECMRMILGDWQFGVRTSNVPSFDCDSELTNLSSVFRCVFDIIVDRSKKLFSSKQVEKMYIGGGFSKDPFVLNYIRENIHVEMFSNVSIVGAEGAALLAFDARESGK